MTYAQWKADSGYSEKSPEEETEGRDCPARSPELLYRPLKNDDWGFIRTKDGKMFATVRRPLDEAEADMHRANKTDPFEDLARRLISTYASAKAVAGDPICRQCATQEHGSAPLPENCICGDRPARTAP